MLTECRLMRVNHPGTSRQLGHSRASAAPGMHRAYSSSLHQLRSVRVLYRQTNTLMLHR